MECLECIEKEMANCRKCEKPFLDRVDTFVKLEEKEDFSGFRENVICLFIAFVLVGGIWAVIWHFWTK